MLEIAMLVGSYILGSVPFGLLIAMRLRNIDIRMVGSGNIGATNVLRTLGPGPAALVFGADVLKGFVPVAIAGWLFPNTAWIVVASGMLAILGHNLSLFLGFKGGKGVATSLGVIIGLAPLVAALGFGVWVLVLILSRYVSLASIVAAVSIPVLMVVSNQPVIYQAFVFAASVFVIFKHRSNITRLLAGKEARWGQKVDLKED